MQFYLQNQNHSEFSSMAKWVYTCKESDFVFQVHYNNTLKESIVDMNKW